MKLVVWGVDYERVRDERNLLRADLSSSQLLLELQRTTLAAERRRGDELNARYDALLEKYHALRQQGHAIPDPRPAAQPVIDEFPATVETAIVVASEGNKGLERHLRGRARLRLARGEDHSAVARLIEKGDGSDD